MRKQKQIYHLHLHKYDESLKSNNFIFRTASINHRGIILPEV